MTNGEPLLNREMAYLDVIKGNALITYTQEVECKRDIIEPIYNDLLAKYPNSEGYEVSIIITKTIRQRATSYDKDGKLVGYSYVSGWDYGKEKNK
jgi:hypothetical protein